jgi:hypothetical protein
MTTEAEEKEAWSGLGPSYSLWRLPPFPFTNEAKTIPNSYDALGLLFPVFSFLSRIETFRKGNASSRSILNLKIASKIDRSLSPLRISFTQI